MWLLKEKMIVTISLKSIQSMELLVKLEKEKIEEKVSPKSILTVTMTAKATLFPLFFKSSEKAVSGTKVKKSNEASTELHFSELQATSKRRP